MKEEDVAVESRWKDWLDAAAEELDMDLCGMDLICTKEGKEYILEVNFEFKMNFMLINR